ncbi:Camp-specific 3',5'-cyclic phosphodiesterase, partial [Globisporangium splendens]
MKLPTGNSDAVNATLNQERVNQRVSRIYPLTDSVYVAQSKKTPVEVKFHPMASHFVNEPRLEKLYEVTFAREIPHDRLRLPRIYSVIVLCWSFSMISGGMFSMLTEWYNYVSKDVDILMEALGMKNATETIYYINSTAIPEWKFKPISGSQSEVLQLYTKEVLLPSATMNTNLLRVMIVFVFVPLLRIDTVHFTIIASITCISYNILTIVYYPNTDSSSFSQNRVLVICFPIMFALVVLLRNRDVDHVATRKKNLIAEENRSLKKELAQRDNDFSLDLTSPLHSLLAELKSFIDDTDMSEEDTNRGMALSVLARKDYTGTRRTGATVSLSSHSNSDTRRSYQDGLTAAGGCSSAIAPLLMMPTWEDDTLHKVRHQIQADGWDLDTLKIAEITGNRPLMYVRAAMFEIHELHEEFRIDRIVLRNFLFMLDEGYLANPYHNSSHAADVVNSVNYLTTALSDGQIRDTLINLEFYAAIVAAAIHDFRHPGKSNNYLIKAKHDLAAQYNDRSILESMHVAETFLSCETRSATSSRE